MFISQKYLIAVSFARSVRCDGQREYTSDGSSSLHCLMDVHRTTPICHMCLYSIFRVRVCLDGFINVDCSVLTSIHITYVYTNTRQYLMFGVPLSLLFTRFYLYIRVCVSERFFLS